MARLSGFVRHTFVVVCFGFILCGFAQGAEPLLLRNPSLNRDKIAFLYAKDVWTVSREGGEARRLTSVGSVIDGTLLFPRRHADRLFHPRTGTDGCVRGECRGRCAASAYLGADRELCGRLDTGWQGCSVRLDAF